MANIQDYLGGMFNYLFGQAKAGVGRILETAGQRPQPNFLRDFPNIIQKPTVTPSPSPRPTMSPRQQRVLLENAGRVPDTGTFYREGFDLIWPNAGVPTPTPTPVSVPLDPGILTQWGQDYPYKDLIERIWAGVDPNKVANMIYRESSFDPSRYHINAPVWKSGIVPTTRREWLNLRRAYPSIDVGLTQLNTSDAMNNYLASKGLTYYDLFFDPEVAIQIAYDLYSGKIPYTRPGFQNWVSVRDSGY